MPERNSSLRRRVARLMFLSLVAWALVALGRSPRPAHSNAEHAVPAGDEPQPLSPIPAQAPRGVKRLAPRRLAASVTFAALFFAGASLSAVAGDRAATLLEDEAVQVDAAAVETEPACTKRDLLEAEETAEAQNCPEVAATEPAVSAEPVAEAEEPAAAGQVGSAAAAESSQPEPEPVPAPETEAPAPESAVAESEDEGLEPAEDRQGKSKSRAPAPEVFSREETSVTVRAPETAGETASSKARSHLDPEVTAPGVAATIWLHRLLPDPTPPSLRLSPEFASRLVATARQAGVDWALVLGVLRAEGGRGPLPTRPATLAETAERLVGLGANRNAWSAALAFTGRTAMSDRAVALASYYRAVGIRALRNGLRAEQEALTERLLADSRVDVYGGGRDDLAAGRVDVRVVALIAYLAEVYGQVTVSSLKTGHRLFARPGVVSAHVYGHAVDVAALGGVPILGHQQPGSVTERAVRDILLLPAEMRPRQLISLIGMGGPSFPLGDHHDHIHVGY